MTTTNQEIYFCKSKGLKIPIRFDIFKHGGGIYLALTNQAEGVHLPLISTAPAMVAELRRVADAIERAVVGNEQAVIRPAPAPAAPRRADARQSTPAPQPAPPAEPARRQEWIFGRDDLPENITPAEKPDIKMSDLAGKTNKEKWELLVRRFPWLFAKDFEYKDAAKYAEAIYKEPESLPAPVSQLELDLEAIRPHLDKIITASGKINKSEIGRILNITHWPRLVAVADALKLEIAA